MSVPTRQKRRRVKRQVVADWDKIQEAQHQCQLNSGNDVISCFPTTNTVVPQHQWAAFVWNSRRPQITQANLVNIYLFHGDSMQQILAFRNVINPQGEAGVITAQVNDSWWGANGDNWNNKNISYPFYWVITRSDEELDGRETRQAVFRAVQTTYADSVIASMASTSSVASASAASLSRSLASASAHPTSTSIGSDGGGSGNVQAGGNSSGFPHWAIAVIVILGFLAIATSCVLAFFILRRIRRRNRELDSNRNSIGSASPMMAGHSVGSPLLAHSAGKERHTSLHHAPSVVSPDGASTVSRVGSLGDSGPFSGADAAIMADAFRQALRKPDFAGRLVEEGESPDHNDTSQVKEELLSRELAEEGRDIRSVSSSRDVKVETLSDHTH